MITEELRWFLAVAETEHVTDAAALVGTTQPTLSRAIGRLEHQLGTPLFDRDRNRLRLNRSGRIYRRHARRALEELESARDQMAALLPPPADPLRLAYAHSLGGWLVPEVLEAYRRQSPDAPVRVRQDSAVGVLDLLGDGSAELAITSPQPSTPGYGWLPLGQEPLLLAVPAGHPLIASAAARALQLTDLVDERFVIMRQDVGLREITCRIFDRAGLTAPVAGEAGTVAEIVAAVASQQGLALVPANAAVGHPGIHLLPLSTPDAYRTTGLTWRRDHPLPPQARRFRAFAAARRPAGP
ncbi:LysR family transcriptional regulator [Kitasatospora sp. NPDC052896]|uniref:LysR family transcriptional regulator n=1 Tax=Kitasatospora sp. NPDC052896 TaxID=3364061 RepID=UPI0037C9B950